MLKRMLEKEGISPGDMDSIEDSVISLSILLGLKHTI